MAQDQQMTVLAWSPLRNGLLSGKYLPESNQQAVADGARLHNEMMKGFGVAVEDSHATVREVVAVAKELGVSAAQVSLAWLRYRSVPVIPIIGARKLAQFEDNLRSLDVVLAPAQLERLDRASAISLGFPHEFLNQDNVRGIVYGGLRDRIKV
jgi:aryl-alcohol dehydrogenase-like predicted oxidoreductase